MFLSRYMPLICLSVILGCTDNSLPNRPAQAVKLDSSSLTDLRFLTTRVNFKDISADTLVIANYPFVNTGKKDLIVKEVEPECTCTGYTLDKRTIPPGDTGFISLKFSTKNESGYVKVYTIVTANTKMKVYSIEIAASIKTNN